MAKPEVKAAKAAHKARAEGILPSQAIRELIVEGEVRLAEPLLPNQLQPASLDLRLGNVAYRVRASFLPGREQRVTAKLDDLQMHAISLSQGAVLETGCVYVAPLLEGLALPDGLCAATNPKSSTGRLDVFTRVIADGVSAFDQIPAGYEAVAVQIDFVAGAAGYVNAGDRINLYGLYTTPTGSGPGPRAELLLTNVEVLDVDLSIPARRGTAPTDPSQPTAQRPSGSTVTYLLALRPVDAEKAIFSTEFASLYATLTADDAPPAGPTPGRDAESILADEPNVAFNG